MSMNITNKLQEVQTKLKASKNQYNEFGNFMYRSVEDILEAVKPILAEFACAILLTDELVQIGERYYIKSTAHFSDGDKDISVSAYAREPLSKKGMDESQITGSTSSYARKHALNGLLAIDDTKDPDSEKPEETPEPENDVSAIVEQAFFDYTTEWKDECPDGYEYDQEMFKKQIREIYKKLSEVKRAEFKWTKESTATLVKKIKPDKVIKEIKNG